MRGTRGTSLAEVVIAILIVAMMAVPIMSVALTGTLASGRGARRVAAASAVRRVSENLKAYVTADPAAATGPGEGLDGWTLPGDLSGARALAPGHHDLASARWAPELAAYRGAISYDVSLATTTAGPQPNVLFHVSWEDP
ncbi:MAG: hypothetical protein HY079_06455 [Elusimicrobia bacterium]|nr:hypothetical protein [Elusimicrobiota bacterium]